MTNKTDEAVHAGSYLILGAIIFGLIGWYTDKFSTMTGQIVLLIAGFLGLWGALAIINPEKYGDNAIKTLVGLLRVGENIGGSPAKKTETTINIGTVQGNLNQNVNSKNGMITTGNSAPITVIDGKHSAKGNGDVTAIDIDDESVFFKPGTRSIAEGKGSVTATRITGNKKEIKK
jgi:hypothetical protein